MSRDVSDRDRKAVEDSPHHVHAVMDRITKERAKRNPDLFNQSYWLERGFTSFSIVRHPIDRCPLYCHWLHFSRLTSKNFRLCSFYTRKILGKEPAFQGMRSRITSLHGNTNFPSFVSYLLDHHQKENSVRNMDVHLRPQVEDCDYCSINYTFVAKFESFEESLKIVLSRLPDPVERILGQMSVHNSKKTKFLKVKAMYALLNATLKIRLEDLYFLDFKLFGYDPHSYDWLWSCIN